VSLARESAFRCFSSFRTCDRVLTHAVTISHNDATHINAELAHHVVGGRNFGKHLFCIPDAHQVVSAR
jgi:hypothetical protein